MDMVMFTPWLSAAGGVIIGVSAVLLMAFQGRMAGISGIAVRLFPPYHDKEFMGRLAFVAGLMLAPLLYVLVTEEVPELVISHNYALLTLGGFLVGFGSVWGNGCTSGHGVCGLSRLSLRSLVATGSFMVTAIITVFVMRHVWGA